MTRKRVELLILLMSICLFPATVFGDDDMSFDVDEVETLATEMETAEDTALSSDDDLLSLDDLGMDVGATVGLGEAAGIRSDLSPAEQVLRRHPIWAVQQVYALRKRRVDFQPSFGVSLNDPYVQHQSFNLSAAYFITEVLSLGLSFNWYRFLDNETALNYAISRATHQTVPINEYFWGGQLNMTYVPLYGKFALGRNWIVHWDLWFIGGAGLIFTRPIPVIDPEYRDFDFSMKFSFNVGVGGRLYLTRFLAVYIELRDYIFVEELESLVTYSSTELRENPDNWIDDDRKLTNNIMLQAGVSLFLPFTFEFKLPK